MKGAGQIKPNASCWPLLRVEAHTAFFPVSWTSSCRESSARRHWKSADGTEIEQPYTHKHTPTDTYAQNTHTHRAFPSPSLGHVFIAALINNSTPVTGEESGDRGGRDAEGTRGRGGREFLDLLSWIVYARPEAKANPYMCIRGVSVCVIVYICACVLICTHVFWQGHG